MHLAYADESKRVVIVTLDKGETLGGLVGTTTAFVPTDPDNMEFAAILAGGFDIGEPS
jgi:hypothetical protein